MLWDLSVDNMSLPFDHTCNLSKSELERCLQYPVSENRNRKLRSESSFLFLVVPIVQFDVVHQQKDRRHKQPRWILRVHSDSGSFCFQKFLIFFVSHFDICTRCPQLVRCHHQWVLHFGSAFSSDLRAYCSAIPVFRLLRNLRKTMINIAHIVDLGRFHFSIKVEIDNVVFEIDKNEF